MTRQNPENDSLTGFLTRRTFEGQFIRLFEKAQIEEKPLSIAFFDIDDMRDINDKYGHAMGDIIVKMVAKTIKEFAGEGTLTGRYGGDEFALIFPGSEREQAFLSLERVRAEMDKLHEFEISGRTIEGEIKISGGLAAYPVDGRNEREILRRAHQALYRAKMTGANKICLAQDERMVTKTTHYTPTQLERLAKLAQEIDVGEAELLREALDGLLIKYDVSAIET